ncbi:MAG: deoxynucleoside kinase, partial [Bacteroidota bacterium]|nr:deoxynucleoside kinase [Bacteroidota bacterium]
IIVYLSKSVEVLQRNIQKRGRTYELNIESKYLQNVEHQYQNYFNSIDYCPVLQFNLNDDQELETLVIAIKNVLEKDWQNGIHLIPSYKY